MSPSIFQNSHNAEIILWAFLRTHMESTSLFQVRVAVTQAEPIWLDLDATVEKTCRLIAEAAANGAQIVTFPECWVPGYPAWI
ncbi:aliphatic nitrilase [Penicillium maclennaniae]|uniref:aliphatic nitrilase n=1 Tax=Penicillium maclennaniae TaxID=1343394 RepID=UPI00254010C0|nr:aliphatic nitrilase [Penicillium maclennaniae]KAJ5681341.1 aliphatic nitrilase [Penicillium maclennaniae]